VEVQVDEARGGERGRVVGCGVEGEDGAGAHLGEEAGVEAGAELAGRADDCTI
jgi:hypothetical protein